MSRYIADKDDENTTRANSLGGTVHFIWGGRARCGALAVSLTGTRSLVTCPTCVQRGEYDRPEAL